MSNQMHKNIFQRSALYSTVAVAGLLMLSSLTAAASGRIIVCFDDWVLSDTGFANAPDTGQFVTNIATWFVPGRAGRFLCSSSFNALSENTLFRSALTNAGNTLVMTNVPLETLGLSNWLTYDALFIGDTSVDNGMLTNYVNAGGNVYLYAIGFGTEPAEWNTFLQPYGLAYGGTLPGVQVDVITNTIHPLLQGVTNLFYDNGEVVLDINAGDVRSQILQFDPAGNGILGVWDPTLSPPMLYITLTNLELIGTVGTSNRVEYVTHLTDSMWTPLTNIFLTQSNYFFTDPNFLQSPTRFYRAVLVP
jgi:hypothetical protein